MNHAQLVVALLPLVGLQVGLIILALRDLLGSERVVRGNKLAWAAVIILGEVFGPLAYFAFGRRDA